jgi:hypothetical protein
VPLCSVSSLVLLLIVVVPAAAQKTVTRDAGGGRKIVLHYNEAGKVIETDTLGPNGELLEKDTIEYKASAYIPQTTSTSYWPNGKPHKVTQSTYDDNSNFTGEFVQVYDEAGKQIGGHRLTRVPVTNIYTCKEWNVADRVSGKRGSCRRARDRQEVHPAGSDAAADESAPGGAEGFVSAGRRARDQCGHQRQGSGTGAALAHTAGRAHLGQRRRRSRRL